MKSLKKVISLLLVAVMFFSTSIVFSTPVQAALQRPTFNRPADNAGVSYGAVTISGANPTRGQIYISVRDVTNGEGQLIFNNHRIPNGTGATWTFTIPQNRLTPGRRYRVAVTSRRNGAEAWSNPYRCFTVSFPRPTFNQPRNHASVNHGNVTVSGNNPARGQMYISMRDVTNGEKVWLSG